MKIGSSVDALGLKACLQFWGSPERRSEIPLGLSVRDATSRAREFRLELREGKGARASHGSTGDLADVLYAVCRLLEEDIEDTPLAVFSEATGAYRVASELPQSFDTLGEREGLLCSLAFLCWRAARMLDLSKEAQHWEAAYLQTFEASLKDLMELKLGLESQAFRSSQFFQQFSGEEIFQALLLLQAHQEGSPEEVAALARLLYQSVSPIRTRLPNDLRIFFLGASARLIANACRVQGRHRNANNWLDIADGHFRLGVDPKPQLARTTHQRLAMAYTEGRLDFVTRALPTLDGYFASVGMEEDRIKCSILWAASLKVAGRFDEAIQILESVPLASGRVRKLWHGWVLLQLGDIHQICGDYERGFRELEQAANILRAEKVYCALADVGAMMATGLRAQGRIGEAIAVFRRSQRDYARLGMAAAEAYTGVLVAEAYLASGDAARAEAEIRTVLPTLERHEMLCDVVAGVNLLREALLRKRLEPKSLRKVCDLLRPKA